MYVLKINRTFAYRFTFKFFKMEKYFQVRGTSFPVGTNPIVAEWLQTALERGRLRRDAGRIRIYYGDAETGRGWNEEHDVRGKVGRSTGTYKVPLLLHNSRSTGGFAILCKSIVKLVLDGQTVYTHRGYKAPVVEVHDTDVWIDGELYATCKTRAAAKLLAGKMR